MSESEIRKLLERACDELDRYARQAGKAILPAAVGAGLALTGCGGAKTEPTQPGGDNAVEVVQADAGAATEMAPTPDAGAAVIERSPPDYDVPRPYMAPDAVPLYQALDDSIA